MMDEDIDLLVRQLTDRKAEDVRGAIHELASRGCRAIPMIRNVILAKTTAPIEVLAEMGFPENADAIPDLVNALRYSGSYPPSEQAAADLLRKIGLATLPELLKVLSDHPEEQLWVREVAWVLLSFDPQTLSSHVRTFARTLSVGLNQSHEYYIPVMQLIGRIGSPYADIAAPTLCEFVFHSSDPDVRTAAVDTIGSLSVRAVEILRDVVDYASKDTNSKVRCAAQKLLTNTGAAGGENPKEG